MIREIDVSVRDLEQNIYRKEFILLNINEYAKSVDQRCKLKLCFSIET